MSESPRPIARTGFDVFGRFIALAWWIASTVVILAFMFEGLDARHAPLWVYLGVTINALVVVCTGNGLFFAKVLPKIDSKDLTAVR